MPSDTILLRRALALGLAVAATALPVGTATAAPVPATPAPVEVVSQYATTTSLTAVRAAARRAAAGSRPAVTRVLVEPPAVVFPDADADASSDHAEPPPMTARQEIAAGCPLLGDPDILRDGAALDGHGLCVRSVEQARTDTAAAAIVHGFGLLGLPYSRSRRSSDGYDDCSSFVGRAYRDAGRPLSESDGEPSSRAMRDAPWAVPVDEPRPGDILWRRGHVAIALAEGYMMHASQPGDVTHVRKAGRYSRFLAVDATP